MVKVADPVEAIVRSLTCDRWILENREWAHPVTLMVYDLELYLDACFEMSATDMLVNGVETEVMQFYKDDKYVNSLIYIEGDGSIYLSCGDSDWMSRNWRAYEFPTVGDAYAVFGVIISHFNERNPVRKVQAIVNSFTYRPYEFQGQVILVKP